MRMHMKLDLHDIVTEEFQERMQNSFAKLAGFGVVFTDAQGRHIGDGGNFTRFCRAINCRADGIRACTNTNFQAIQLSLESDRPAIFVCHAGLVNIELPILHDGECIGAFTAGQVLCEEDCFPHDDSVPSKDWLSDPTLAEYYREIPVLSRTHIENTADVMIDLVQYMLGNHTHSLMQQELARQTEALLRYDKRQIELEHMLTQAKFAALQRQVMPHFIFNVLNSVSRLISLQDYDASQKMLTAFTQMMRYQLTNAQNSVSLHQELEYVRNYLAIQKQRFDARVACEIHCDPELGALKLPFFTLQPLVENALRHGILKKPQGGGITISCKKQEDGGTIIISDDGAGIPRDELERLHKRLREPIMPHDHVGLYNCYNRLKLTYSHRMAFALESVAGAGTTVTISIRTE